MGNVPVFLLVEPSAILRSSLHDWLEQALTGHRILVAANGMEGLRLAVRERPSHILLEMELPEKNGFDVLRQMCQSLPEATIVATGWYESRVFLDKVQSLGANGFIRRHKLPSELLPLWNVPLE